LANYLKISIQLPTYMGIPSYFSFIVKNHPSIMKKLSALGRKVDNLYLDSNSIIYDCLREIEGEFTGDDRAFEEILISNICEKLDTYMRATCPSKTVYIAFDGVAPVAKLEQQRVRRYKSGLLKQIKRTVSECPTATVWDQTAITPGTKFMGKLGRKIKAYYRGKTNAFGVKRIIVSSSNECGEGEHKIFQYIRTNSRKHTNETTLIYGLDADLIMLCLNHLPISKRIYLYRETPEFIKSIDANLEPNESYFLDIPELSRMIVSDMNNYRPINSKQQTNRLYDYIFLCFFLGNDFMPHFPAVNIRTGGVHKMTTAYKNTIGKTNQNLTDGKNIFWNNVYTLVSYLADAEHSNLVAEYKLRNRWEKRSYSANDIDEKMEKLNHIPTKSRTLEKFIDPFSDHWEKRYYTALLHMDNTQGNLKKLCTNYMEGLEWTMKYYTSGCADWRWKYDYNYPPLMKDLVKYIPRWPTVMIEPNTHVSVVPYVQLAYVLPRASLGLLPSAIHADLLRENTDCYSDRHSLCWAFCKYFWESHVLFPHVDIGQLEAIVARHS